MNIKVQLNMLSNIEHYRSVLKELLKRDLEREIRLVWTSGKPKQFENQRISHKYAKEVELHILEASVQLKNLLDCLSEGPSRYGLKEEDETENNFNIPDEQFETKIETLNYLIELFEEMQVLLKDIGSTLVDKRRVNIHINEAISNLSLASAYCAKILQCIHNIEKLDE